MCKNPHKDLSVMGWNAVNQLAVKITTVLQMLSASPEQTSPSIASARKATGAMV